MTMKTSCISRWSKRVHHFSNPAVTEPFARKFRVNAGDRKTGLFTKRGY